MSIPPDNIQFFGPMSFDRSGIEMPPVRPTRLVKGYRYVNIPDVSGVKFFEYYHGSKIPESKTAPLNTPLRNCPIIESSSEESSPEAAVCILEVRERTSLLTTEFALSMNPPVFSKSADSSTNYTTQIEEPKPVSYPSFLFPSESKPLPDSDFPLETSQFENK